MCNTVLFIIIRRNYLNFFVKTGLKYLLTRDYFLVILLFTFLFFVVVKEILVVK